MDEVEEKQKLLAKLKERNEKVLKQKEEISQQLDAQRDQSSFIKSLKESNERQLEQEKHLIKIAEMERGRLAKELLEAQQKLQEKEERCKALTNIYESQRQLYEHLNQSDEAEEQLRRDFNDRIARAEKSCTEMKKALENDNKTGMELEVYLKKLTKQIFEKQRELEKFKLGELEEVTKIESVKRAIRKQYRERKALKEKYMQILASIEGGNAAQQQEDSSMKNSTRLAELKLKLAKVDSEIIEIDRKRNSLERIWNDLQDKLSKLEVQLAEVSAKENIEQARNKRYETKIEILKLEPVAPMYKAYGIATSKVHSPQSEQKKKESTALSELIKKRHEELEEIRGKSMQAETAVTNLRKRLQELRELESTYEKRLRDFDKNEGTNHGEQQSDSIDTGRGSTESALNSGNLHVSNTASKTEISWQKTHSANASKLSSSESELAAKGGLNKANAKRDKFLNEQISEAEIHLKEERKQLADDVAVLTTKANAIETANENLKNELKKLTEEEFSLREKIANVEAVIKLKEEEATEAKKKMMKERDTEKTAYESRLEQLIEEGEQLKRQRNELKMELKNNEIMINNYRNRYNTLSQLRKNIRGDKKEVAYSLASLVEWRNRVSESEKELQSLEAILATANRKNQIVKNDLMTMKPYSEETAELKRLYAEERALELQLNEAKCKLHSLQMEKNGEIVFDNKEDQ